MTTLVERGQIITMVQEAPVHARIVPVPSLPSVNAPCSVGRLISHAAINAPSGRKHRQTVSVRWSVNAC